MQFQSNLEEPIPLRSPRRAKNEQQAAVHGSLSLKLIRLVLNRLVFCVMYVRVVEGVFGPVSYR